MATLRYSQIRAHPGGTIRYIANKDKIISGRVHDVYNVLNYMGEPESTERVYSFGHHCSTNPSLAEKQIALHRARYFENKKGGIQGATGDNAELLGLHFFMSYTEADDPSEAVMNEILFEIATHPKLKDFAVFGANHFDKKHKHTHFYVSQYSAEGKPRKLCLRKDDYDDIRRYANRLCVERGLSVIDLEVLRKDPEYSAWLDRVIAQGKVTVHPEREEHKHSTRQKATTTDIYYRWLKEQEEMNLAEEKLLTEAQLRRKKYESKYYCSFNGKNVYAASGKQKRFYAVRIYTPEGRKRSTLELLIMLIAVIAEGEKKYIEQQNSLVHKKIVARVDPVVQTMIDSVSVARELSVETPDDIPDRLADVGKQMNALKQEHRRHENSIKKHEAIIAAWDTYERIRPLVEGVSEPQDADLSEYKKAYAVLAANQVLTAEAFVDLRQRYLFESRKVSDYDKRIKALKRQYRALKYLEATNRPFALVDEIYSYSAEASRSEKPALDDIIKDSERQVNASKEKQVKDRGEYEGRDSSEDCRD